MYQKILLAYDGTDQTAAALRQAAELARLCNAELHVLGVVAVSGADPIIQAETPIDLFAVEREELHVALHAAAENLGKQGLSVVTSFRQGNPAHQIAEHAREIGADLAVIGHTDKGFLARWLVGSTGAELVRHLPCNLLISTRG